VSFVPLREGGWLHEVQEAFEMCKAFAFKLGANAAWEEASDEAAGGSGEATAQAATTAKAEPARNKMRADPDGVAPKRKPAPKKPPADAGPVAKPKPAPPASQLPSQCVRDAAVAAALAWSQAVAVAVRLVDDAVPPAGLSLDVRAIAEAAGRAAVEATQVAVENILAARAREGVAAKARPAAAAGTLMKAVAPRTVPIKVPPPRVPRTVPPPAVKLPQMVRRADQAARLPAGDVVAVAAVMLKPKHLEVLDCWDLSLN